MPELVARAAPASLWSRILLVIAVIALITGAAIVAPAVEALERYNQTLVGGG